METITNVNIRKQMVEEFMPFGESLRAAGFDDNQIIEQFNKWVKKRSIDFYKTLKSSTHIALSIKTGLGLIEPDSKIELIFHEIFETAGIPFEFQYKIGPYRVDFLIDGLFILEIDGPHHAKQKPYDKRRNAYMRQMGYETIRIPANLATIDPSRVVAIVKSEMNNEV